jgi:hypothetical protein
MTFIDEGTINLLITNNEAFLYGFKFFLKFISSTADAAISDYNNRIITIFLLSFISHSLYVQDTA